MSVSAPLASPPLGGWGIAFRPTRLGEEPEEGSWRWCAEKLKVERRKLKAGMVVAIGVVTVKMIDCLYDAGTHDGELHRLGCRRH